MSIRPPNIQSAPPSVSRRYNTQPSIRAKEANAVCWNLSPFIDIIRAKVGDASSEHRAVNGVWFASGLYLTPVVGSPSLAGLMSSFFGLHFFVMFTIFRFYVKDLA